MLSFRINTISGGVQLGEAGMGTCYANLMYGVPIAFALPRAQPEVVHVLLGVKWKSMSFTL